MEANHPAIKSVAGLAPSTLIIEWADGKTRYVNVSALIEHSKWFAPLREDPARFHSVQVASFGFSVVWPGQEEEEIDLPADAIWRQYVEQSGGPMAMESFRAWRRSLNLTQKKAAEALGISVRQVQNYETGEREIPKYIRLATFAVSIASARGHLEVVMDSIESVLGRLRIPTIFGHTG